MGEGGREWQRVRVEGDGQMGDVTNDDYERMDGTERVVRGVE